MSDVIHLAFFLFIYQCNNNKINKYRYAKR